MASNVERGWTRQNLDTHYKNISKDQSFDFLEKNYHLNSGRVYGALQRYTLEVPLDDKSIAPCLTGEVGGMVGAWENWITTWHLNNLQHFDIYFDIGANVGYYGFLANYLRIPTVMVEANPYLCTLLGENIPKTDTNIEIVNKAVWINSSDGEFTVKMSDVTDHLYGSAHIVNDKLTMGYEVKPISLYELMETYLGEAKRPLVKMDIEEAEDLAFYGAAALHKDKSFPNPTYLMEYTPGRYGKNFYNIMKEYGKIRMLSYNGFEHDTTYEELEQGSNWKTIVLSPYKV